MLMHDFASWPTGREPSWLGTSPVKWPVRGSVVEPTLASPCRAVLTASAWLWRCLGGQAHLVSLKLLFATVSLKLYQSYHRTYAAITDHRRQRSQRSVCSDAASDTHTARQA